MKEQAIVWKALIIIITVAILSWLVVCNCINVAGADPDVHRQLQELVLLKGVGESVVLHSLRIDDQTLNIYRTKKDDPARWDV